eukprot:CAMPEP_0197077746 /NCGR_PEP_ID=MMETSP1384-20130603/212770_1 /TAXON_ID=29189 /ORGANISM="Ammonia sp." /LENGTH=726 /DNA_ID=CAMNT_0042516611 /DNA_START=1 /DNA_END=2181 /DNA_ORIENTATION=-
MATAPSLYLLASFITLSIHTSAVDLNLCSNSDASCEFCVGQTDFDAGTYTITNAGTYCFAENIEFVEPSSDAPSSFASCIISIQSSDVILDLQQKEISQSQAFYLQHAAPLSIIQIGDTASSTISNINIYDGVLGLTPSAGINIQNANNVNLQRLRISDFDSAGIYANDVSALQIEKVTIGPSNANAFQSPYYQQGRLVLRALSDFIDDNKEIENETVTFSNGETDTLLQIHKNLQTSLDIAYRSFFDESTTADLNHYLYDSFIDLYSNPLQLPSMSGLYGIVLDGESDNVTISDVKVQDLTLNTLEVPAAMFDCNAYGGEDGEEDASPVLTGPAGKTLDLRKTFGDVGKALVIELGDFEYNNAELNPLKYQGNPVSDAIIALAYFQDEIDSAHHTFYQWALEEYEDLHFETLPPCVSFVCNMDIDGVENEGIIGIKMNGIGQVKMENVVIKRLINKSPLSSYSCANYTTDIKGSDTKGVLINGGDVTFDGFNNVIEKLISYSGSTIGLQLDGDAQVVFDYVYKDELPSDLDEDTEDDRSSLQIQHLCPGHEITFNLLSELSSDGLYPNPNAFYACNILNNQNESVPDLVTPFPPNGIKKVWCADYVPEDPSEIVENVLPVQVLSEEDNEDTNSVLSAQQGGDEPVIHLNNENPSDIDVKGIYRNHPDSPYVFFVIGVSGIMLVVLVMVCALLKCAKYANRTPYQRAKYLGTDDDSDDTEDDEEVQ